MKSTTAICTLSTFSAPLRSRRCRPEITKIEFYVQTDRLSSTCSCSTRHDAVGQGDDTMSTAAHDAVTYRRAKLLHPLRLGELPPTGSPVAASDARLLAPGQRLLEMCSACIGQLLPPARLDDQIGFANVLRATPANEDVNRLAEMPCDDNHDLVRRACDPVGTEARSDADDLCSVCHGFQPRIDSKSMDPSSWRMITPAVFPALMTLTD